MIGNTIKYINQQGKGQFSSLICCHIFFLITAYLHRITIPLRRLWFIDGNRIHLDRVFITYFDLVKYTHIYTRIKMESIWFYLISWRPNRKNQPIHGWPTHNNWKTFPTPKWESGICNIHSMNKKWTFFSFQNRKTDNRIILFEGLCGPVDILWLYNILVRRLSSSLDYSSSNEP